MINPDNFVFHTNFEYNAPVIKGYKEYTNAPVSGLTKFELASGIQAGDRFRVVQESGNVAYNMGGPFPNFGYHVEGGKLYATIRAQSVGQTFTGRFHYRVYRKNKAFIFNSKAGIEKVIFQSKGTMSGGWGNTVRLTNTAGKKMFLYGTWRVVGTDTWYSDGYSGNAPGGTLGLESTDAEVTLRFGGGNGTAGNIEYRIVGTDLYGT